MNRSVTSKRTSSKRTWRAAFGAILGAALILGPSAPAVAADDDEDLSFEQKIFRGLLGLKSEPAIEYRERSPLVVPPSSNLPPPETAVTVNNPSWPVDADVQRRRENARAARSQKKTIDEEARPLTPQELEVGRARGAGLPTGRRAPTENEAGKPVLPSDLGYFGGLFGSFFGKKSDGEYATFTGEPPRTSLIEPPPGYQTPSSDQPFGVGTEKFKPNTTKYEDRGTEMR